MHRCIGLHFAKLQIQIAFEELFKRVRNLRIPEGEHVLRVTWRRAEP